MAWRRYRWVATAFVVLVAGLAACSQPKHWALQDINGLMPQLQFNLTDDTGQAVNASDYRGKIVLLYFGYTHCPDVCPTTLGTLSLALHQLGADADKVRVLFVSVDPKRDTPELLKRYVSHFDPAFIGVTGPRAQLDLLTRPLGIYYAYQDDGDNYAVDHSAVMVLIGPHEKLRATFSPPHAAAVLSSDYIAMRRATS